MIANFGGAEVDADGTRNYPGSGGMIGGLSFPNAGMSNFTGAGKSYERFTPYNTQFRLDEFEEPIFPIETGGGPIYTGGGGSAGGGSTTGTTPVNAPYLPSISGGNRGYGAIQSGGNQVLGALNSIFSSYQSGGMTLEQALLNAQQYAGYLSNPAYFYQAQYGDDAALLTRLKMQAASIVNAIRGWFVTAGPKEPLTPTETKNPTQIPIDIPPSITKLLAGLVPPALTKVDQPANLFSFTPTGAGESAPNNTVRNIVILAIVAFVGYWAWKKYA